MTANSRPRGRATGLAGRRSDYTPDSDWRNRAEFVNGRDEIVAFLTRK